MLAENLLRLAAGRPLRPYRPQPLTLALISSGDRNAVASWGRLALEGRWVWGVKDRIDRRWMRKYQELPAMGDEAPPPRAGVATRDEGHHPLRPGRARPRVGARAAFTARTGSTRRPSSPPPPPCAAGAAAPRSRSAVLHRVLGRLPAAPHPDCARRVRRPGTTRPCSGSPPTGSSSSPSTHFRTFIDDPHLFGRIATNHCLSDLFAMGAEPRTAQAMVTLPFAAPDKVEQDLFDLLSGVTEALAEAGAVLVGGHTAEGTECALGLTVNGLCDLPMLKAGAADGDRLLLTKPLGTGVVFAADMRAEAPSETVEAALASMLRSNEAAARIFREHEATSCTDVTGFGLLGHLVEMLRAGGVDAELDLAAIPRLPGADALFERGFRSSLHEANAAFAIALHGLDPDDPRAALLIDPADLGRAPRRRPRRPGDGVRGSARGRGLRGDGRDRHVPRGGSRRKGAGPGLARKIHRFSSRGRGDAAVTRRTDRKTLKA